MNHLLLGKKPLVTTKPRRPANPGAIPSPKVKRPSRPPPPNSKKQVGDSKPTPNLKVPTKREQDEKSSSSSSTEMGNGHDTASDLDDLPDDAEEEGDSEESKKSICTSHSAMELTLENRPKLPVPTSSQSQFLDDLLEQFDHKIEQESERSNDRALQLIQENSEILSRLLHQKSEEVSPQSAPTLMGPKRTNNVNRTIQSNPATRPITFNPFPNSARANRKPKEVGRKLGLYK